MRHNKEIAKKKKKRKIGAITVNVSTWEVGEGFAIVLSAKPGRRLGGDKPDKQNSDRSRKGKPEDDMV